MNNVGEGFSTTIDPFDLRDRGRPTTTNGTADGQRNISTSSAPAPDRRRRFDHGFQLSWLVQYSALVARTSRQARKPSRA
jgi:hypothetical protein